MKKIVFLTLVILMLGIVSGSALAQNNSVYFVTYYANNTIPAIGEGEYPYPDATLRIINDGENSANFEGTLYASIYVFDDSQELQECCSCPITADGLLSESVRYQLTSNPLTGIHPYRGVIKVISSRTESDASTNFAPNTPVPGLRGWATHIQSGANYFPLGAPPYVQTEDELANANLSAAEKSSLEMLCKFDKLLSGHPCWCTPEDYDF